MNGYGSPYGQPASAWQEHHTPDGRAYYYNATTKVTQWTKPEDMMSSAEVRLAILFYVVRCHANMFQARPCEPTLEGVHGGGRSKVLV